MIVMIMTCDRTFSFAVVVVVAAAAVVVTVKRDSNDYDL